MRIYSRHQRHAEREAGIAKVIRIIDSVGGGTEESVKAGTRRTRNTAADVRVLRMIPVTAEGVAGTIPGTNPLDEYLAEEARIARHGVR